MINSAKLLSDSFKSLITSLNPCDPLFMCWGVGGAATVWLEDVCVSSQIAVSLGLDYRAVAREQRG